MSVASPSGVVPEEKSPGEGTVPRSGLLVRCPPPLVLAVVVLVSMAPYVSGLGFYSDDWDFLSVMSGADRSGFAAVLSALDDNLNLHARPTHLAQLALLYEAFGLDPLGYHLVNAATLVSASMVLYLVLVRLSLPRAAAFAAALLWALAPSYSTDKFWFAAFGYVLMMLTLFVSVYGGLRALDRASGKIHWGWAVLGLTAFTVCGLGHEIALPLLVGSLLLLAWRVVLRGRRSDAERPGPGQVSLFFGAHALVLAGVLAFKVRTAIGAGGDDGPVQRLVSLARAAGHVHLGSYGLGLPSTTWWAARDASALGVVCAVVIGVVTVSYMWLLMGEDHALGRRAAWTRAVLLGIVTMAMGYAIFLVTPRFSGTSTGLTNRIHIAGALGAALLIAGVAGLVASSVRARRIARGLVAALVTIVVVSFSLTTSAISRYWVDAYQHQEDILARLDRALPALPDGASVILAGQCPYLGPAVVFESGWDLRGALAIRHGDPGIQANVVTSRLEVGETGLRSTIYGEADGAYPYGAHLYLYDDSTQRVSVLDDLAAAEETIGPVGAPVQTGCPPGVEGWGVSVIPFERHGAGGLVLPPPTD